MKVCTFNIKIGRDITVFMFLRLHGVGSVGSTGWGTLVLVISCHLYTLTRVAAGAFLSTILNGP